METTELRRSQILFDLAAQYNKLNQWNEYPAEFKAQGYLTECNFGGLLVIINKSGDGCIVWGDWAGAAISETLTECEIEYREDDEDDTDEEGNKYSHPGFMYNDTWYWLNDFMKI